MARSAFPPSRRTFIKYLAMLGVGGSTWLRTGDAWGAVHAAREAAGMPTAWPAMPYRTLGRTGFEASRLIFGCGAALSSRPNDALLGAARDAGINVFDVGWRGYYRDAERHLAGFARTHRDEIFLVSKAIAPVDVAPDADVTPAQARAAATAWQERLDGSLRELTVDHVDAYYLMGADNPSLVRSDEIHVAFERARQAGKVRHLGVSTHRNAEAVLAAAAETGRYSLAMIAITPAGWYDWESKGLLSDSKPLTGLRPVLETARRAGVALVGMKAGRYLAGRRFLGRGNLDAFDGHYDPALLASGLSPFQRSYAYVLAHGLDVVNADMQTFAHLHENVVAASTSSRYAT
jgi:aryl-alcohol dehydrogenase-like predicted oxidoreductase